MNAASTKSWLIIGPPNGFGPRSWRQASGICKRADTNDRIVAPVVAFCAMPPVDPVGNERAINPACELLKPRKQSIGIDDCRQCLNKSNVGMTFHCIYQADDGVPGH